jgi:phosphoribosylanthranilate isomerase
VKVKICGITNLRDADEAVRLGAWAIGLVHHAPSPRACPPEEAARIGASLRRRCEVAGVFVNPSLDEVGKAVEDAGLTMVQLSGDEGPSFCTEVARRTGVKVMKAIHVSSAAEIHGAEVYRTDYHLFDTARPGRWGGTGESFDWDLLRDRSSEVPMVLAGGVRPANLAAAIETARPFAIDVSSGVEAEPGLKDHGLLADLFEAARAASPQAA